jgi:hypothetical protein
MPDDRLQERRLAVEKPKMNRTPLNTPRLWPENFLPARFTFTATLVLAAAVFLMAATVLPARAQTCDNFPELLGVYYGIPSLANGAGYDTTKATKAFKKYDVIVFGDGLENITIYNPAEERARTTQIISNLQAYNARVYGYIDLGVANGNSQNLSLSTIYGYADNWAAMGVAGIFLDEAGYNYQVPRDRLNSALDYIHNTKHLSAFVNAWNPDDVFSSAYDTNWNPHSSHSHLGENDYYLLESYAVEGDYINHVTNYVQPTASEFFPRARKAVHWNDVFGTRIATLSTVADLYDPLVYSQQTPPPFDQTAFNYVWWSTVLFNFDAMGSAETQWFGGEPWSQNLTYHARPQVTIGAPVSVPVSILDPDGNGLTTRTTTTGTVTLNTIAHTGSFN